jgi:hypothetical protein
MPVTPPDFKTGSGQPAFTTETQCGDYTVEYALGAAEPTALIIRAPFMETRADYARPAANSNITYGGSTAYFIDDLSFQDLRAGVAQWTREWATIPASWSEPEEYAFTYPAYSGTGAFTANVAVSAITASGANYILSCTGGTIVSGDTVFYSVGYTRGGISGFTATGTALAVATTNSSQVTITVGLAGTGSFTGVTGNVAKVTTTRAEALTLVVGSRVVSDYALTTAANINADLPLVSQFQIINSSTGAITDTLGTGTSPTAAVYLGYVAAGTEIVAECSRRRYLGNIYVRRTRYVPAR